MRGYGEPRTAIARAALAVALLLTTGCVPAESGIATGHPTTAPTPPTAPTATASARVVAPPVERAEPRLVRWHGPVEGLFVHPLILRPELAFGGTQARGFLDYFITAREFRVLLEQLWRNGWTLVDVHRAAAGTVRVPEGRRPLVLYEDDVNYYRYFRGEGLASRLVLDPEGEVRAELPGGALSTADVVPLVDAMGARHPEFSADGAKGVLAMTGFEGLLGERDPTRSVVRSRLARLAGQLRDTGWTFASHTYGHIDLSTATPAEIRDDTRKWRAVTAEIGPVDVLVYPYGARPGPAALRTLVELGYPIQVDIDIRPRRRLVGGAIVMSRRHVDGLAFDAPARQRPFYDVGAVRDPRRPWL